MHATDPAESVEWLHDRRLQFAFAVAAVLRGAVQGL